MWHSLGMEFPENEIAKSKGMHILQIATLHQTDLQKCSNCYSHQQCACLSLLIWALIFKTLHNLALTYFLI